MDPAIERLHAADASAALEVINEAAVAYRGVIPEPFDSDPYLSRSELAAALDEMALHGAIVDRRLVGVIGLQERDGVSLIRHLYVRPDAQRAGVGTALLESAIDRAAAAAVMVGTWRAARWAVAFYERHGFESLGTDESLLSTYWDIPDGQLEASVVLRYER